MADLPDLQEFIRLGHKQFLPHLSIDCVLFGYHERQLRVLLLKWKQSSTWSLPGGFIRLEEPLEEAVQRILLERTGLRDMFWKQFGTFGDPARSRRNRRDIAHLESLSGLRIPGDHWLLRRTVSIGYYAVTEYSRVQPQPDAFSDECRWWDVDKLPRLAFDHNEIISGALQALRTELYHHPIGYNLLPRKFTLPEIHDLYETILGKRLDRRNFPKKLLSLGLIRKLREQRRIGPHRSPYLYRFDKRQYDKALREGVVLAF
ncbi:MAG TPA: NUDIX domain-containing protein [Chitinophagaceae bacterium]|nr:NUDIX domain-containing protein [Chitinophagaceae bacterium]